MGDFSFISQVISLLRDEFQILYKGIKNPKTFQSPFPVPVLVGFKGKPGVWPAGRVGERGQSGSG